MAMGSNRWSSKPTVFHLVPMRGACLKVRVTPLVPAPKEPCVESPPTFRLSRGVLSR